MMISESQIDTLRELIKSRMSMRRYHHTLGVEKAAVKLGNVFCPSLIPQLRCAALLHDITKELPDEEAKEILRTENLIEDDVLWQIPAVFHSLTAPSYIQKYYPEFATQEILSAVLHHTVGDPSMSLFDKIIFISDYVEENRSYPSCVSTRAELFEGLKNPKNNPLQVLNSAILCSLDATILSLISGGKIICPKTVKTRNAILSELSQE